MHTCSEVIRIELNDALLYKTAAGAEQSRAEHNGAVSSRFILIPFSPIRGVQPVYDSVLDIFINQRSHLYKESSQFTTLG
jgi:hypothetical protein